MNWAVGVRVCAGEPRHQQARWGGFALHMLGALAQLETGTGFGAYRFVHGPINAPQGAFLVAPSPPSLKNSGRPKRKLVVDETYADAMSRYGNMVTGATPPGHRLAPRRLKGACRGGNRGQKTARAVDPKRHLHGLLVNEETSTSTVPLLGCRCAHHAAPSIGVMPMGMTHQITTGPGSGGSRGLAFCAQCGWPVW